MASIRRRDTSPERLLRRELWRLGVRGWRCDYSRAPGRPDIAFVSAKIAVFVDGQLWHGHPARYPGRLDTRWRAKIARNIARDRRVDEELTTAGWTIIRMWDCDLRRNPQGIAEAIKDQLLRRRESRPRVGAP